MATSTDVANFYITLYKDRGDYLSKTKIHKLLYFAQGWNLARTGKPLFDSEISAMHYGPVVTSINLKLQPTSRGVTKTIGSYDPDVFTPEEIGLMLDVACEYGRYSTKELSEMTHEPGTPWSQVHTEHGELKEISQESMKEYFSKQKPLRDYTKEAVDRIPAIKERNSKGNIVLPADWDDDC